MSAQGKALVEHEEAKSEVAVSETAAILSMIERMARDPSVDITRIERLMDMRERIVAQNAKGAYHAALAEMQPELPIIRERGKIDIGKGKPQFYALWEDINEAIRPALAKHGFALSFRTNTADGKVAVTGILSHRGGHAEETTMQLSADVSGSKNAVQAIGSSTSYGKRYTAMALLNLTSGGEDDDGNSAAGAARISEEQFMELRDSLEAIAEAERASVKGTLDNFCRVLNVTDLGQLPASRYREARALIDQKRRGR